jgi:hypothetical protein
MIRHAGLLMRLALAVTAGTLLAGASTKIWYACQPPSDDPGSTCRSLAVLSREVGRADGRFASEGGVASVMVVEVEPAVKCARPSGV